MAISLQIKNFLPKSLFGRSLAILITPLILLQVVIVWIFLDRHWENVTWRLSNVTANDIAYVIGQLDTARDPELLDGSMAISAGNNAPYPLIRAAIIREAMSHLNIRISFVEGGVLSKNIIKTEKTDGKEFTNSRIALLSRTIGERTKKPFQIYEQDKILYTQIQMPDGILKINFPIKRIFSSTIYLFLFAMLISSFILIVIAVLFLRNQIQPILKLADTADAFGKGQDNIHDIIPRGAIEVRRASVAFNRMQHRIQRQIRQRTDMLSSVSHDLRTPITRMKLQLAMLPKNDGARRLQDDLLEMESMIQGYLAFARGEGSEASQPQEIGKFLETIVEKWKIQGKSIDLHIENSMTLSIKANAFKRCIDNIIANACYYAQNIWVRMGVRNGELHIIIDDDGPGIPKSEYVNVFRPFYRLEQSRNRETGGTGLGMSIARDIAQVHGGNILLEKSPYGTKEKGLRVIIALPL
jgi:two-component system osmolarity sensor histidine kinase EnvZ